MMPSLYAGVSGLRNHSTRMNVVSNNISNVNTYGFKYSRVAFQDMLSMNLNGAAAPNDSKGGINPKQFGLGMQVASIDKIFTQGSLQTTGKTTDVAITGEGFFPMRKGEQLFYTRAGDFDLDRDGVMVNPANGFRVQGWMAETKADGTAQIDSSATVGDITIPMYGKLEARATEQVWFKSNLDVRMPVLGPDATPEEIEANSVVTTIDVYDSEGEVSQLRTVLWHSGENQWTARPVVSYKDDTGQMVNVNAVVDVPGEAGTVNPGDTLILNFNTEGSLVSVADSDGNDILGEGQLTTELNFTIPGRANQNVTLNLGESGRYNGVTQFAAQSSTKAYMQDGYGMGYLESFMIDDNGVVTGSYDNGQKKALAQLSLAVFTNPGGLKKAGQNYFVETNNSGMANIGEPDSAGRGNVNSGKLEMSNVDLAEQFTDMIITERGFQANSRSVTTSDQMLQELLSLKR